MLRRVDGLPVKLQRTRHTAAAADGPLAEDDAMLRRLHGEHAQVEQLVVQRAQRQAVGFDVRPADVMSLDVRSLQARRHVAYTQVEATNAAPVLVGAQHALTKRGVAPASPVARVIDGQRCTVADLVWPV